MVKQADSLNACDFWLLSRKSNVFPSQKQSNFALKTLTNERFLWREDESMFIVLTIALQKPFSRQLSWFPYYNVEPIKIQDIFKEGSDIF